MVRNVSSIEEVTMGEIAPPRQASRSVTRRSQRAVLRALQRAYPPEADRAGGVSRPVSSSPMVAAASKIRSSR